MKSLKLFALLFVSVLAHSQEYKLGNVTKAELEEKQHHKDPSAPAAVLYSKSENYMAYSDQHGFQLFTDVEMKVKIYKKEGYDYANKTISYFNADAQREIVSISKAYTYNLVNGKIEKAKLKSEGEFDEVINKNWKSKKIMMPDVKEGSVIEYKYTIVSPFISVMPDWSFQQEIPVNHSELTTRIPEYFTFNTNVRGYYTPKVTNSSANKSLIYKYKEQLQFMQTKATYSNEKLDFKENIATYEINDLPALKDESYVSNISNYTSGIEHEISMIQYPGQAVKSFSNSWEDVSKTIYKNDNFGAELKKTGYFEEDINALIAGLKTPQEKTAAIFMFVKNNMNWNNSYGYNCDAGVKKAYKEKVGNVAEINLMLTAMLRFAGLDANPVLVSTRSHKITLFPNHSAFNYVVSAVKIGEKQVVLDATSKWSMPGVLPVRAVNWEGRLIKDDGTSQGIPLNPEGVSKEAISFSVKADPAGVFKGKARDQYFDYNAYIFRENYAGVNKDSYLEKMEARHKGLEIGEYKITNDKDVSKPVMEEYEFTYNNGIETIGEKLYISPMLFLTMTENPFKQEKREYPIDFVFPHEDKYMINITLPEGYTVESIPQSTLLSMEENIGSFRYTIQQQGNAVQLMITNSINYNLVPANYYDTLKNYYQKVIEKQTEKIVLKKG